MCIQLLVVITCCAACGLASDEPAEVLAGAYQSARPAHDKSAGTDTLLRLDLPADGEARWHTEVSYPQTAAFQGCRLETFYRGPWSAACPEVEDGEWVKGCVRFDFVRGLRRRTGCADASLDFAFESVDVTKSKAYFESLAYVRTEHRLELTPYELAKGCAGCAWPANL